MDQVDIGTLLPGAIIFNDKNVNLTWKAHVRTHEDTVVAYVKDISPRSLYIECVCAVIGRAIGLPIPKPIIVEARHEALPSIPEGYARLFFGSLDTGYPSFRRYAQSEEAYNKLKSFSKTLDIAVFDEWIANWDRNIGNILYDGGEDFYFIDHENAIGDSIGDHEPARGNEFARVFYANLLSEFEKYRLSRDVDIKFTPIYKNIPYTLISEKTFASAYLSETEVIKIIDFLKNRANALARLFHMRLEIKQQGLVI